MNMKKILFLSLALICSVCLWAQEADFTFYGCEMGAQKQKVQKVLESHSEIKITTMSETGFSYGGTIEWFGVRWTNVSISYENDYLKNVIYSRQPGDEEENARVAQEIKNQYGHLTDAKTNEEVKKKYASWVRYPAFWAVTDGQNVLVCLHMGSTLIVSMMRLEAADIPSSDGLQEVESQAAESLWTEEAEFIFYGCKMGSPKQEVLTAISSHPEIKLTKQTEKECNYSGMIEQFGMRWTEMSTSYSNDRLLMTLFTCKNGSNEDYARVVKEIKDKYGHLHGAKTNVVVEKLYASLAKFSDFWAVTDGKNVIACLPINNMLIVSMLNLETVYGQMSPEEFAGIDPITGKTIYYDKDIVRGVEGLTFYKPRKEVELRSDSLWTVLGKVEGLSTYTNVTIDSASYDMVQMLYQKGLLTQVEAKSRFRLDEYDKALAKWDSIRSYYAARYTNEQISENGLVRAAVYGKPQMNGKQDRRPIVIALVEEKGKYETFYLIRSIYFSSEPKAVSGGLFYGAKEGDQFNSEDRLWWFEVTSIYPPHTVALTGYAPSLSGAGHLTLPSKVVNPTDSITYTVTSLGPQVVSNFATSVNVPVSVKTIQAEAFLESDLLTSLHVKWKTKEAIPSGEAVGERAFEGIAGGQGPAGATLYVPKGTARWYRSISPWKDFGNIVEE